MVAKKRGSEPSIRDQILNGAIEEGLEAIAKAHPKFRDAGPYIYNHIDRKKLTHGVGQIDAYIAEHGADWSDEKKAQTMYDNLANYVASGGAFDDRAKEVILKKGLEEKTKGGWFSSRQSKRDVESEKYIDQATAAFRDLYDLMKSGDHAERMPEFAEAVTTINDLGFLDAATDVLKGYGLIHKHDYKQIKDTIKGRVEEESRKINKTYEHYLKPKKVAASLLTLFGLALLIASGFGITGAVIGTGTSGNVIGGLIGVALLIAGALGFSRRSSRKDLGDRIFKEDSASRDRSNLRKQLIIDLGRLDSSEVPYDDALRMVYDTLSDMVPTNSESGVDYNKDLNYIAKKLHSIYPTIETKKIRRDLGAEELHSSKRKYGRRGR